MNDNTIDISINRTTHQNDNTVKILDAFTGAGKTTYIFKDINRRIAENIFSANAPLKFIYVSPYLTEVGSPDSKKQEERIGRIHKECEIADFKAPTSSPTKSKSLKRLLSLGENICCTHELFKHMDIETAELISQQRYEVIIDEALDVIQPYPKLSSGDKQIIMQYLSIDPETNLVSWTADEIEKSRYEDIKMLCKENRLYFFRESLFLWELPPQILTAAKQVTICTYLFKASVLYGYFQKHSIPFEYIDNEAIGLRPESELLDEAKNLIEFIGSSYVNKLSRYAMSATAYKQYKPRDLKIMKTTTEKLVERSLKGIKSSELIWTCYKDQQQQLKGKGYSRSFLSHNARATNDYSDRKAAIYLIDRYPNTLVSEFLKESNGEGIDKDLYGLSEMIQWLWRTRIRKGESIKAVIPSKRMRELLERWLEGKFLNINKAEYKIDIAV